MHAALLDSAPAFKRLSVAVFGRLVYHICTMKKYDKYKGVKVTYDMKRHAHMLLSDSKCDDLQMWTVYTKDPQCGRGDYAEEIDVLCTSRRYPTEALHVAQAVIDDGFSGDLRPVVAVFRPKGIMFW